MRRPILYVEDNEDDVKLVREIIPKDAYDVVWAPTAARAREILASAPPHLLLLDHGMPDTNSLRFLNEIRSARPDLPVIVLTGREDEALAVSTLENGASGYVLKDEMQAKLRDAIRQTLHAPGAEAAPEIEKPPPEVNARQSQMSQHLYQVLLSAMNDGCLLIDFDGIITFANEAAGRLSGCEARTLLGRPASDIFDAPTLQRLRNFGRDPISGQTPEYDTFECGMRATGKTESGRPAGKSLLMSVRRVEEGLSRRAYSMVVLTDISELIDARNVLRARLEELVAARQELSKVNSRLRELDELRRQFVSIVSHDLRAPLTAVSGSLDNLLDGVCGGVSDKQRQTLEIARRNASRLARLIDNLLDLSQLEAGVFKLKKQRVDVRAAVRHAIEDLQATVEKSRIGVSSDMPEAPLFADVDPDRMTQVVVNFLDNALRFAKGRVWIRLGTENSHVRLTVEDDGPGIPDEYLKHIFNRFSFVKALAQKAHTGLGLSIVRGIVDAQGGEVWAENRTVAEGGGARFVVMIPIASTPQDSRATQAA